MFFCFCPLSLCVAILLTFPSCLHACSGSYTLTTARARSMEGHSQHQHSKTLTLVCSVLKPTMPVDRESALKLQMYTRRMSEAAKKNLTKLDSRPTAEEQALLSRWQWVTLQWGGLASFLTFVAVRLPPWPLGTLSSTMVATMSGLTVASIAAAREAASIMLKLVELPGESKLVDEAICPSLLELEGCVQDEQCAKALNAARTTFRDADSVMQLVVKCRARAGEKREDDWWQKNTWEDFPAQPSDNAKD